MPAEYDKFKTPFFEISIGDSQGSNMTALPPQLARLVEKVDINETLCCNSFNQITIVFNEGSREPYNVDGASAPEDVYPSGGQPSGLSNQSGMLTDLRIPTGGLAIPVTLPTILTSPGSTLSLSLLNAPPTPDVEPVLPAIPIDTDIHYLLQQRNQVSVKWGYKESPDTVRIASAYIMMVTSEFPEAGTPKVTVVCHDSSAAADQIVTNKSRRFGLPVPSGTVNESTGKPLFEEQDLPIHLVLAEFCDVTDCIISLDFRAKLFEQSKTKQWFAGHSLHQFLSEMARRHNAVYKFLINPGTGKDTLIFISREDWEQYPIVGDESLFHYRGNGSLIKSVNIRADFGGPVGTFLKGINEEGGHIERNAPAVTETLFASEKQQDNSPLGANSIQLAAKAEKAARGGLSGAAQVSAETAPENLKDLSRNNTNKQGSNLVSLDFSCLGFTLLSPGTLKFSGIGERYTGFYNVKTVTHSLGSDGYQCKGTAVSFKNSKGGVSLTDDKIQQGIEQVSLDLFNPVANPVGRVHSTFIKNGAN